MKLFGSLRELINLVYRKDSQEITLRPNQSTTYTSNVDVQLAPSTDTTQTLVEIDATQTLSNKSIDADTNTITNIENADIKAGAAIDATKIADGSVSNAEFQALNGVTGTIVDTSSVQTLTNKTLDGDDNTIQDLALTSLKTQLADADKVIRRDAAGIVISGNSLPNSSAIVTTDATQTLTAKTIDGDDNTIQDIALTSIKTVLADADKIIRRDASGAVISGNALPNSSAIVTTDATQSLSNKGMSDKLDFANVSTPSNPAAGNLRVYSKNDDKLYTLSPSGTETQLGAGGGSSSFNIRTSEGSGTTTFTNGDNHYQRFNLTADRTAVLPITGVSAGDIWVLSNPNAYRLTVQADDTSVVAYSYGDEVTLVALVNTPATNADWAIQSKSIIYLREKTDFVPNFITSVGSGATSIGWAYRQGPHLMMHVGVEFGTGATGTFSVEVPFGLTISTSEYILGSAASLGDASVFQSPYTLPGFPQWTSTTEMGVYSSYNVTSFSPSGLNYTPAPNLNPGDYIEFTAKVLVDEFIDF